MSDLKSLNINFDQENKKEEEFSIPKNLSSQQETQKNVSSKFSPKEEIRLSIERSIRKVSNLKQKSIELSKKLERLQEELLRIETSYETEFEKLQSYVLKPIQARGSFNPTEEQIQKNKNYNSQLQNYKKESILEHFPKETLIGEESLDEIVQKLVKEISLT